MADKTATLIIRLKDMASDGLKGIQSSLGALKTSFLAVTAAGAAFIAAGFSALKEYASQEAAVNKLETALRNQGLAVEANSKELQAYASELQRTTTFSDDAIIETQALLTTFGASGEEMRKATQAALDLSTGLGIDLKSATMLVGKAMAGETATLGRYGIKISETIPEGKKFEAVLGEINARFGGSAQSQLDTVTGKIENFKNRISDVKETIGAQLLPVFDFWMQKMETIVGWVEKLTGAEEDNLKGRELTIKALQDEKAEIISMARAKADAHDGVVRLTGAEQERIRVITDAITRERELLTQEQLGEVARNEIAAAKTARAIQMDADELARLDQKTAAILLKTQTKEQQLTNLQKVYTAQRAAIVQQHLSTTEQEELLNHVKRLEELGKFEKAKEVIEATYREANEQAQIQAQKNEEQRLKERAQALQSWLSHVSSLQSSHNKSLATIGKAAAISEATINTYRAATGAYAALSGIPIVGPALGAAAAALAVTAGLANVARIRGTPLAEGGVVMPRPGGTLATIGEAGSAEAVIPLDDDRAQQMIGGGKTEIHIHAGTIVADRMSIKEFAITIDRELYNLERNRLSVRV